MNQRILIRIKVDQPGRINNVIFLPGFSLMNQIKEYFCCFSALLIRKLLDRSHWLVVDVIPYRKISETDKKQILINRQRLFLGHFHGIERYIIAKRNYGRRPVSV